MVIHSITMVISNIAKKYFYKLDPSPAKKLQVKVYILFFLVETVSVPMTLEKLSAIAELTLIVNCILLSVAQ